MADTADGAHSSADEEYNAVQQSNFLRCKRPRPHPPFDDCAHFASARVVKENGLAVPVFDRNAAIVKKGKRSLSNPEETMDAIMRYAGLNVQLQSDWGLWNIVYRVLPSSSHVIITGYPEATGKK